MRVEDQYHRWVEWSDEDQVYIGKCPDSISGMHGENPVQLYADLCETIEDVVAHFERSNRALPPIRIRPMQEVWNQPLYRVRPNGRPMSASFGLEINR